MTFHLSLQQDGAQRHGQAAASVTAEILSALEDLPEDRAGVRLWNLESLKTYLEREGVIGSIAAAVLGNTSRPVRALLFNKTASTNWSLAWHQDRTICVKQRVQVAGFGPWSVKRGMQHVAPPFDLLARMITVRVHLDDVPATNAPLLIAPGSHTEGRVPVERIEEVVARRGIEICTAEAGDVWVYSTPILHASDPATQPKNRRVLQVDYSPDDLPKGLNWAGI